MSVIDLFFPKNCLNCGKGGKYICLNCLQKVHLSKQVCIECEKSAVDGMTHSKCLKKRSLDGSVSIWTYEGVVRKAITKLKYRFAYEIAKELAETGSKNLKSKFTALPKKAILTPIPLHPLRYNWRGFNQSEEIGKLIAKEMGWRFISDILVRKKQTVPQANLSEKARQQNVKGIFVLNAFRRSLFTDHQSLILFDDVWTTGATLREAGKVLKHNGADKVWGLTITR